MKDKKMIEEMVKYQRITNNNREEYNPEYDFCVGCKYFGEPNGCNRQNGTCGNYERFIETYNQLEELEDKIEKGTLKELSEDSVVLSREEYNEVKIYQSYIPEMKKAFDKVSKAAVEKFFDVVMSYIGTNQKFWIVDYEHITIIEVDKLFDFVMETAKQFGLQIDN